MSLPDRVASEIDAAVTATPVDGVLLLQRVTARETGGRVRGVRRAGVVVIAAAVAAAVAAGPSLLPGPEPEQPPETVAAPPAPAPEGPARVDATTVRNNQEPPAAVDVAVLARGTGLEVRPDVTMVGYQNKAGAMCWGWANSMPGLASLCFGPKGPPDGSELRVEHQVFLGGEPARPPLQVVFGVGPAGTSSFRFEVGDQAAVTRPAQASRESEARGLSYFAQSFTASEPVTVTALNSAGDDLGKYTVPTADQPPAR